MTLTRQPFTIEASCLARPYAVAGKATITQRRFDQAGYHEYHQEARMLWQRCPCCEGAGHHDGDHCFTCDGRGDFGDWS